MLSPRLRPCGTEPSRQLRLDRLQLVPHDLHASQQGLIGGGRGVGGILLAGSFHRADDDADQQVEHDERGQQDVGHEEDDGVRADGLRLGEVGGEVLQGEEDEQGQHRPADRAPGLGQCGAEERPADHPVDEQQQDREDDHAEQRRDGLHDRQEQDPGVREVAHEAHDPRQPQEPQQLRLLAHAGNEDGTDDHEIEDVPAAPEEVGGVAAVRGEPQDQLDDEDGEAGLVEEEERVAPGGGDRRVGLESQHDGVEHDHRRDDRGEAVGVDQPGQPPGAVVLGHDGSPRWPRGQ